MCSAGRGCLACDPALGTTCVGDVVRVCTPDGTISDEVVATCALEACVNGACLDPCGAAAQRRSYLGCEYYPVDLDNNIDTFGEPLPDGVNPDGPCALYGGTVSAATWQVATVDVCQPGVGPGNNGGLCDPGGDCADVAGAACAPQTICIMDAQHAPFAVVVSNPDPVEPAEVQLSSAAGFTVTAAVAPGAVVAMKPQDLGFPDQSLSGSGIDRKAYRLVSSRPIVAYQFNPLDHDGVFSNDASLLLPAHAWDERYYVASWPSLGRRPYRQDSNGFLTVVVPEGGGPATVTVTAAAGVRPGPGVPRMVAGSTRAFTVQPGETLNLEAVAGGDLTGSLVASDRPVGVFSGHQATTRGPADPAPCCMDHLEDQVFPTSAWGKTYAVARSVDRGAGEPDLLRVLAQKPNTLVTFDPPGGGAACPVLGPGEHCDVYTMGDMVVSGSEPILVAHYLVSTGGTTAESGDPALAFAVPVEQYRRQYTFLVPEEYLHNYVSLVVPAGRTVALDGQDVTALLAPIGAGAYLGGRVAVATPGQHKLDCPGGCGALVYGWYDAVSYLFAAGLDLEQITID